MIIRISWIVLLLLNLFACREQSATESNTIPPVKNAQDPTAKVSGDTNAGRSIQIKDSFDYSTTFLNSVESSGLENIRLADNKIILDNEEEYEFPSHLRIFRMNAFFGQMGDLHIKLLAERINQSTIAYELLAGEDHYLETIQKGGAHLQGDFFLHHPYDINETTGNQFPVVEYFEKKGACTTTISIGKEDAGKLMARISKACHGQPVSLATDQPLQLIEK